MLFGDNTSAAKIMATDDPEEQQKIGRNAAGYIHNVWKGKNILGFALMEVRDLLRRD